MNQTVYIRLRNRVQVRENAAVFLKDIALINAPGEMLDSLDNLVVHQVTKEDRNIVIIDGFKVIKMIRAKTGVDDIQLIGPEETIVEVVMKKKKMSVPVFLIVWLLLFTGSAISIMNFHEDVSMQKVHEKLFFLMTGIKDPKPLLIQIPYSIGIGLGMILFFNHLFKKRINEEPSPLEVEMFSYQQSIDQYLIFNEKKENMKRIDE